MKSTAKCTENAQSSQGKETVRKGYFHNTLFVSFAVIFLSVTSAFSQSNHFARLTVSPKQVLAGQAFNVRITVYTPTWFTKAPNFGEYQVRNSFTVKTDRAQSLYETINGIRYTTLYYEYIVFPLEAGTLKLPAINVEFESPEEGDYKGKLIKVSTNSSSIKVLPVNGVGDSLPLFVANSVTISEKWNKSFNTIKIGEVLERTITIKANGTLSNIIPPLKLDTLNWASIYKATPSLSQTINNKEISSVRIEKHTYLLEEEGVFTIPEVKVDYYNQRVGKWVTRSISATNITVLDNPDLYALKTLQDSLNAAENIYQGESKPLTVFGVSIKKFMVLLACLLGLGWVLILIWKRYILWYKAYREQYLESERYYFRQLLKTLQQKNNKQINENLYRWLSKLDKHKPILTISELGNRLNSDELINVVNKFHKLDYSKQSAKSITSNSNMIKTLKKQLLLARKSLLQRKHEKQNLFGSIRYSQSYNLNTKATSN